MTINRVLVIVLDGMGKLPNADELATWAGISALKPTMSCPIE